MVEAQRGTIGVVFPGQGSQETGMGRDVAENDRYASEIWELAEKRSGAPLREIFWEGDREAMTETRYQQPALVAVSLTLWQRLPSRLPVAALAGHSVGEYAALAAAGVLAVPDVIDLVCLRGRLMFEAGQSRAGKMAALLKLDQSAVQEIVDEAAASTAEELCIANYNTPAQLVVSGSEEAVDLAMAKAKERRGRPVQLPVSGAFHSKIMEEPARELAAAMDSVDWHRPGIPVYFNVNASAETDPDRIKAIMQRQMISPVKWSQTVETMWQDGVRTWIEVGSKDVLTKMMRYNLAGKDGGWQAWSIGSLEALEQTADISG